MLKIKRQQKDLERYFLFEPKIKNIPKTFSLKYLCFIKIYNEFFLTFKVFFFVN